MREISFSYETHYLMPHSKAAIHEFLSSINNFHRCSSDVEKFELIDENTANWTLKLKEDMGIVFQAHYTLEYNSSENSVSWNTLSGNTKLVGQIEFSALDDANTTLTVKESVSFELPVSMIMSKIVKPIALSETRNDMKNLLGQAERILASEINMELST